jgi:hypothetical protein
MNMIQLYKYIFTVQYDSDQILKDDEMRAKLKILVADPGLEGAALKCVEPEPDRNADPIPIRFNG